MFNSSLHASSGDGLPRFARNDGFWNSSLRGAERRGNPSHASRKAKIIGIMACGQDGVVGNKGAIPWYYPEEFRHFRDTIGDCPIIAGRKTFDGLPASVVGNRTSIVFSRTGRTNTPNVIVVSSLDEFFALDIKADKIFLIGGAELANFFLEQGIMSEFILTKVKGSYAGDAFLNLKAFDNWRSEIIFEGPDYSIYKLTPIR